MSSSKSFSLVISITASNLSFAKFDLNLVFICFNLLNALSQLTCINDNVNKCSSTTNKFVRAEVLREYLKRILWQDARHFSQFPLQSAFQFLSIGFLLTPLSTSLSLLSSSLLSYNGHGDNVIRSIFRFIRN